MLSQAISRKLDQVIEHLGLELAPIWDPSTAGVTLPDPHRVISTLLRECRLWPERQVYLPEWLSQEPEPKQHLSTASYRQNILDQSCFLSLRQRTYMYDFETLAPCLHPSPLLLTISISGGRTVIPSMLMPMTCTPLVLKNLANLWFVISQKTVNTRRCELLTQQVLTCSGL